MLHHSQMVLFFHYIELQLDIAVCIDFGSPCNSSLSPFYLSSLEKIIWPWI